LFILYRRIAQQLAGRGFTIVQPLVGHYATSMEMAGCSVSILFWTKNLRACSALRQNARSGECDMGLTAHTLRHAVAKAAESARRAEDELNAADGKLGDGDTGIMLRRLFEKALRSRVPDQDDIGAVFQSLGAASASATGSSLGPS
jgi:dihydroxyacetone kinase